MENRLILNGVIGVGAGLIFSGYTLRQCALINDRNANVGFEEMTITLILTGGMLAFGGLLGLGDFLSAEHSACFVGLGLGLVLSPFLNMCIPLFIFDDTSATQMANFAAASMTAGLFLITGAGNILNYVNNRRY